MLTTRLEDFALKLGGDYLHQRHFADGFRHAIEVLETEASDDVPMSRDALCWAARILRDYADKEEPNETD